MSVITVAQFCGFRNVDEDAEAACIAQLHIDAAQERLEAFCDRRFEEAAWTEYHDVTQPNTRFVYLRNPPVASVTSLQYDAQEGTPETVASGDYILEAETGKITLHDDESYFPVGDGGGERCVKVVYTGGWTAQSMPAAIKLACLRLASYLADSPDADGKASEGADGVSAVYEPGWDIPRTIANLVRPYRLNLGVGFA